MCVAFSFPLLIVVPEANSCYPSPNGIASWVSSKASGWYYHWHRRQCLFCNSYQHHLSWACPNVDSNSNFNSNSSTQIGSHPRSHHRHRCSPCCASHGCHRRPFHLLSQEPQCESHEAASLPIGFSIRSQEYHFPNKWCLWKPLLEPPRISQRTFRSSLG